MVNISGGHPHVVQAKANCMMGKAAVVLLSGESLFLCRSGNSAIRNQAGSRIVVERRQAEIFIARLNQNSVYMKGASTEPCAAISNPPMTNNTRIKGSIQSFFRARRNRQSSSANCMLAPIKTGS